MAAETAETTARRVALAPRSPRCSRCGQTTNPLDARINLGDFLSPQSTRLAYLAAMSWSFDVAWDRKGEFANLRLDDETIRRHCHRAGEADGRRREPAP